jgi:hypothetical protein
LLLQVMVPVPVWLQDCLVVIGVVSVLVAVWVWAITLSQQPL